jgi:hypothetical protein
MKTKTTRPTGQHHAFRDDLVAVMRKHHHLSSMEMLALASHFVGQLVALQDARKVSPAMAMELVALNVEAGNASAISDLMNTKGSA